MQQNLNILFVIFNAHSVVIILIAIIILRLFNSNWTEIDKYLLS